MKLTKLKKEPSEILSSISANIVVIDQAGIIIEINQGWENLSQENRKANPSSRVIGNNFLSTFLKASFHGDEISEQIYNGIRSVLAGRYTEFDIDYAIDILNKEIWFNMSVRPLEDLQPGAVIVQRDITEQKIVERKLAHQDKNLTAPTSNLTTLQRRFDQVERAAKVGSLEWDKEEDCIIWSSGLSRILEYPPQSLTLSFADFLEKIFPEDRAMVFVKLGFRNQSMNLKFRMISGKNNVVPLFGLFKVEDKKSGLGNIVFGTCSVVKKV